MVLGIEYGKENTHLEPVQVKYNTNLAIPSLNPIFYSPNLSNYDTNGFHVLVYCLFCVNSYNKDNKMCVFSILMQCTLPLLILHTQMNARF